MNTIGILHVCIFVSSENFNRMNNCIVELEQGRSPKEIQSQYKGLHYSLEPFKEHHIQIHISRIGFLQLQKLCSLPPLSEDGFVAKEISAAETLAKKIHETYEHRAPDYGFNMIGTPWEKVSENSRKLMISVCDEIIESLKTKETLKLILPDTWKLIHDMNEFLDTFGTVFPNNSDEKEAIIQQDLFNRMRPFLK